MNKKIRLLIVDDSALMRKSLVQMLDHHDRIEIVGIARDGEDAVEKALELKPEVITLDINMPKMDGLTSLQYIMKEAPCSVIILSSLTQKGALTTFEAMELGAFDYVAKPDGTISSNIHSVANEIVEKILAAGRAYRREQVKKGRTQYSKKETTTQTSPPNQKQNAPYNEQSKVVVIGVSTGGPNTLMDILPELPSDYPFPIIIVQHMPGKFTRSFAERLDQSINLHVVEAKNRMLIQPGTVYLAPGGKQLSIDKSIISNELRCTTSFFPKDTLFKPSVDVTMLSLLKVVPAKNIIGVILTGIGNDGMKGMGEIYKGGGVTIAESEETAVVYGMPKSVVENNEAKYILPSHKIGKALLDFV